MDFKFKTAEKTVNSMEMNEEDEEDVCGLYYYMGRTFFDFKDESSLPLIYAKTFLIDCIQNPKILFHKEFEFFRTYLKQLKAEFLTLPVNSIFRENHEDNKFYVDIGDKKCLDKLKKRIYSNDNCYWASIYPVARNSELGLVIFEWTPVPFSVNFLKAFICYCRTFNETYLNIAERDEEEKVHHIGKAYDYITDFLMWFHIEKNMDVEIRNKDAEIADNQRNGRSKIELSTDPLCLYQQQSKSSTTSFRATSTVLKGQKAFTNLNSEERTSIIQKSSSCSSKETIDESKRNRMFYKYALQFPINEPPMTVWVTEETKKAFKHRHGKLVLEKLTLQKGEILSQVEKAREPMIASSFIKPTVAKSGPYLATVTQLTEIKTNQTLTSDAITLSSNDKLAASKSTTVNPDKKSPQKLKSTSLFSCDICWFAKFQSQEEMKNHLNIVHFKL